MTTQKLFKRRVRERMAKTGERYAAARRQLVQRKAAADAERPATVPDPQPPAPPTLGVPDLTSAEELASEAKLREATGRGWLEWIGILDGWAATTHTHGEIAEYLRAEHGVPSWWTQAVTNGYERARGMRRKHQQADGFTIYASKTIGVPLDVLFDAFADDALRARWLADGSMSLRNARRGKIARFDSAGDGGDGAAGTRIEVTFEAKGADRATAHVAHSRLADATLAEEAKARWKARLVDLKAFLEARP